MSPTVLRVDGFRIHIPTFDHEPPHVHAVGDGVEVVVNLLPLTIRDAGHLPDHRCRRLLRALEAHQFALLQAWRQVHG